MPMDTDGAEQVRRTVESLQTQLNDVTIEKERLDRSLKREMDRADSLQKIVARHGLDCEFRKKLDEMVLQNHDIKAENERLQIEIVKTQDKWADEVDSLNRLNGVMRDALLRIKDEAIDDTKSKSAIYAMASSTLAIVGFADKRKCPACDGRGTMKYAAQGMSHMCLVCKGTGE